LVRSTGGIPARRQTDVTTVTAHIDAGTDLAGAVADLDIGVPNKDQVLSTARCDARPGRWKRTALRDQLIERGFAIDLSGRVAVEIDRPQAACRAHRCADHGVGILLPPPEDLRFISSRVLEPIGGERLLVDWIARKDWNAAARIIERSFERGWDVGLRLGHYVTLPPSS
jgi:hypothetical protein